MNNTIMFVHIKDSAWKGIYLSGEKISDGYFNVEEIKAAEEAFIKFGGILGFTIKHLDKEQFWFAELGGVLPDTLNDMILGEVKAEPDRGPSPYKFDIRINYY